jgi:putative transposase
MIKAQHRTLSPTTKEAQLLKNTQQEAARCWNDILAVSKAYYESDHAWISKNDLQKQLTKSRRTSEGTYVLHSQTVQGITDKYCDNRKSTATHRRNGNKEMKYPWRFKNFLTVPFKQAAIRYSKSGSIVLSLAAGVSFDTGFIPLSKIHTCELLWRKGKYILSYTSEYAEQEPRLGGLIAGGDIGEIHPIAICDENGEGFIVSGREIRSIKQLRNKSLAWFSRTISRCTKGSRRYKKLIRAKHSLINKTDDQLRDLLHQATRKAIDYCLEHGIAELIIGNPAGVEKNTKKEKRLNRKSRQKVSQMETGMIKKYLQYKAKEEGVKSRFVGERNTSKECPDCGKLNKPRGRVYRCKCGFTAHRDGKAAFMMIRKAYPETPSPESFIFRHIQSLPKYRKRQVQAVRNLPACVDGPDVAQVACALAGPLCSVLNAA